MSFSYQFGANPPIDWPRLLISDTTDTNHIFEDSEITAATVISQQVYQSAQFYSGTQFATLPTTPVDYYRVAALLLDSIAANKSRLASITQLLDVKLAPEAAAKSLRDQAAAYRELSDNSGAFAVIEQVHNMWTFKERFFKQAQRLAAI